MPVTQILSSYIFYLIHPFRTHEIFLAKKEEEEEIVNLSVYESLGTSWVFVVLNGMFRIILLNLVLTTVFTLMEDTSLDISLVFDMNQMPGYTFFVLSAVLDVIFYPLFGFFIIQYWEMIIKLVGRLLDAPGDLSQKAHEIISVQMASHIFKIVPIFGTPAQSFSSMVLMYAGLRKQLNASPALSICVILSPVLMMLLLASVFMLMTILIL